MTVNKFQYKFDDFKLLTNERLLVRGDEILPISCRAFEILFLLVKNEGKVLLKQDLMEKVWEDSFVEDGNLTVAINSLRKVLKTENNNTYIETYPKRGYRFTAKVEKILVEDNSEANADENNELKQSVSSISNLPSPTDFPPVFHPKSATNIPFQIFLSQLIQRKWLLLVIALVFLMLGFSLAKLIEKETFNYQEQIFTNSNKLSIAILPFVDLKPNNESVNLGENFANSIKKELAQTNDFLIASSLTLEQNLERPPQIQKIKDETDADLILAGTFLREDGKLEVEYQLIEVKTGKVILNNKENLNIEQQEVFNKKLGYKIKLFSNVVTAFLRKDV